MKVGLQLPSFSAPGWPASIPGALVEVGQTAEAAGFASLWLMDHFFQLPVDTGWGGPDEPMLEAYTSLGYIAHATERIELGALVSAVTHRPPAVLVKTVTTLDVLSGGRAWLGVGAGWYEREARGLGIPWPARSDRFALLGDTLRLAHRMWSDDRNPFSGRTVTAAEPISSPPPLRHPHPPILVGGGGERTTLRLVARFADACNILVPDPGESRHKLEVLRRHCDDVGRDIAEIEATSLIEIDLRAGRQRPADVVAAARAQRDEGIAHVIVNLPEVYDPRHLEVLGREVVPAIAAL